MYLQDFYYINLQQRLEHLHALLNRWLKFDAHDSQSVDERLNLARSDVKKTDTQYSCIQKITTGLS